MSTTANEPSPAGATANEPSPAGTADSWAAAARLVRRTGFGGTGAEIDRAAAMGTSRYLAVILAADPTQDPGSIATPVPALPPIPPLGRGADQKARMARRQQLKAQLRQLTYWWLQRMVATGVPFVEKSTFCWHNHFATAATKVRVAGWMAAQNEKLRTLGRSDFRTLALSMLTDAATLYWLDGEANTSRAPNENLSREFIELFALGHGDGYTETDVREGARALTGWRINADGSTVLKPALHDSGSKTVLGVTGDLDSTGFCAAVLARPAAASYLVTRTYNQLVSDHPPTLSVVETLLAAYGADRNLSRMYAAMLGSPDFTAARGTSVVNPVEWLIGAVRALRIPITDDPATKRLTAVLTGLGQVPFYPPTVGGWPAGQAWLSTAAADLRMKAAAALAAQADLGGISASTTTNRLDAVAHLLGVPTWSNRSRAVLSGAAADPRRLVTIALNTPEYLTN